MKSLDNSMGHRRDTRSLSEIICYCFNYTVEDIRNDVTKNGHYTILERIQKEKKANGCNCAANNPKGR